MGDPSQQYVKLTKEPAAVEITPGELNQPVDVPQVFINFSPFLHIWILIFRHGLRELLISSVILHEYVSYFTIFYYAFKL